MNRIRTQDTTKVTPAMAAWCAYIAGGGNIYRDSIVSGYRGYKEKVGGKSITYVMGLQLEAAGLVRYVKNPERDSDGFGPPQRAELTDAGTAAAVESTNAVRASEARDRAWRESLRTSLPQPSNYGRGRTKY